MSSIKSSDPIGNNTPFNRGEPIGDAINPTEGKGFAVDDSNTRPMFFPRAVRLTLPNHAVRVFQPGMQDVPVSILDHETSAKWLRDNGAGELKQNAALPLPPYAAPGTQAYASTVMNGAGIYDATLIPSPETTDTDVRNSESMATIAAENVRIARENLENAVNVQSQTEEALRTARERHDARRFPEQQTQTENLQQQVQKPAPAGGLPPDGEVPDAVKKLSPDDRKKFDKMSDVEKAKFLAADDATRANMLS